MNIERSALSALWRMGSAIGLCLSVVGCATSPPVSNIDAGLVTVPVEFQDYSGQPSLVSPKDSALWLGTIPRSVVRQRASGIQNDRHWWFHEHCGPDDRTREIFRREGKALDGGRHRIGLCHYTIRCAPGKNCDIAFER